MKDRRELIKIDREDKIRKLAYHFYLKRNCKEGNDLDDWLKAEGKVFKRERSINGLFKFIKHPLLLIIISGIIIWCFQQRYIKNEETLKQKFEVMKKVSSVCASYYQEIWNQWFAFRDNQQREEYRRNIQRVVIEAKAIETQLPILFKDKTIYKDWREILRIFWDANYPVSREGISEQQLNERLNSATPLIGKILNRMYRELK